MLDKDDTDIVRLVSSFGKFDKNGTVKMIQKWSKMTEISLKCVKKHYFENCLENCCIIYRKLPFTILNLALALVRGVPITRVVGCGNYIFDFWLNPETIKTDTNIRTILK